MSPHLSEAEREALGRLAAVYENDDASLTEWHPCSMCPQPGQPCACAGRPYLSQPFAVAIERILDAHVTAAVAAEREAWVGRLVTCPCLCDVSNHWEICSTDGCPCTRDREQAQIVAVTAALVAEARS